MSGLANVDPPLSEEQPQPQPQEEEEEEEQPQQEEEEEEEENNNHPGHPGGAAAAAQRWPWNFEGDLDRLDGLALADPNFPPEEEPHYEEPEDHAARLGDDPPPAAGGDLEDLLPGMVPPQLFAARIGLNETPITQGRRFSGMLFKQEMAGMLSVPFYSWCQNNQLFVCPSLGRP